MKYVVVGGGIAGVSCAFSLLRRLGENDQIVLISASEHVKTFAEFFTVSEERLFVGDARFTLVKGAVVGWDTKGKELRLADGSTQAYDRLCIATGANPRCPWNDPRVLVLRDSDSAATLQEKASSAKRLAVIGNGGIATELIYELQNVDILWIMRDAYPSAVFLLPQVSKFLESRMMAGRLEGFKTAGIVKREQFAVDSSSTSGGRRACALGPDWNTRISLKGAGENHLLSCYLSEEVANLLFSDRVTVVLSSGATLECDMVVCATGVNPNSKVWKDFCPQLVLDAEGGITVDEQMRTSVDGVFACGDVCSVDWPNMSDSWKQMRLWTQARQMGDFCARSMLSDGQIDLDFCFEMFAHVTTFCGFKVVLLGDYKAERQPEGWYIRERIIGDEEYVCCVMVNHRVVGATLVGDTHLDETIENLILNRTDISQIEEHFLDPGIDIEDYFD